MVPMKNYDLKGRNQQTKTNIIESSSFNYRSNMDKVINILLKIGGNQYPIRKIPEIH